MTLHTYASDKNQTMKILEPCHSQNLQQKLKILFKFQRQGFGFVLPLFFQTSWQCKIKQINLLLDATPSNILSLLLNQFLTMQELLVLRKTCKDFKSLLQPSDANMITFCKNVHSKEITDVHLSWFDLKHFLKQSYYSAFHEMEMFNIKENQYAVLIHAPEKQIIVWHNNLTLYPQILFQQATQNTFYAKHQHFHNEPINIFNKCGNAWVKMTNKAKIIITGGIMEDGGDSSSIAQSQLQNVKVIVSNFAAFAALLADGRVVAWGNEEMGGEIPDDIQIQLQNVKMIYSSYFAFAALLANGRVVSWGDRHAKIPNEIQIKLQDVQMIFSTDYAFAALLNNGHVFTWGISNYRCQIPYDAQSRLQNVKMLVSTNRKFAALLNDGSVVVWDDHHLYNNISPQLQNVKMIFSTNSAFSALLNDGNVVAWGNEHAGGNIPDEVQTKLQNVKMIFCTNFAFSALLNCGTVVAWGNRLKGGKIPDHIQHKLEGVKIIFSTECAFVALLDDGSILNWGKEDYGHQIFDKISSPVKMIIPNGQQFTAVCRNGKMFTWPDYNEI